MSKVFLQLNPIFVAGLSISLGVLPSGLDEPG